ncbi:hypothetical protein [Dasania marina]|uniref:hypothetical protein n=1 Tax=Dasania marina TaxID=471499 RepID=UPI0030D7B07D|tara:strand:+ start:7785 stop:8072 length:288 start_codon:yes stop_codon:yes gene_type:complete
MEDYILSGSDLAEQAREPLVILFIIIGCVTGAIYGFFYPPEGTLYIFRFLAALVGFVAGGVIGLLSAFALAVVLGLAFAYFIFFKFMPWLFTAPW